MIPKWIVLTTSITLTVLISNAETSGLLKQTSQYFLSQNAAGWYTSEDDCEAYFGKNATLLYIESLEELEDVNAFFQSGGSNGTTYWVGGLYNTDRKVFTWGNGVDFLSWAPWDAGYPDTTYPTTRVSLHIMDGPLKLQTQLQTVSNRYICELHL